MQRIKIITPDPILETLLAFLTERLPEPEESAVLLDAVWMDRIDAYPDSRVIVFTASADPACLDDAREAGADGFWYLRYSVEGLEKILRGGEPFPANVPEVQLGQIKSNDLTARELDVLRELAAGKTDAEIGHTLNLAIPTVKHHIQQLRQKTGLSNRTQMAVCAVGCGLIAVKEVTKL